MEKQVCIWGPTLLPVIERGGTRYVVDLMRGHFRELASPYEALAFESERGRALAAAAGVRICRRCGSSFIAPGVVIGIRCIKCAELIEPALSDASVIELAQGDGQERAIIALKA